MKELKRHKMYLLCFTSVKSVDIVSHMRDVIVSILTYLACGMLVIMF